MRNLLTVTPQTRINDFWISSSVINGTINSKIRDNRLPGEPNDPAYRFQSDFYRQFACDIVSETVLDYPYPYISEKTLRPISSKRMFILLGAVGTLDLLHKKGFVTFGDIIDESYDHIQDPEIRFLHVVNEIKKFCSTPLSDIKLYMSSIQNRLDHNFNVLQDLQTQELNSLSKILTYDSI